MELWWSPMSSSGWFESMARFSSMRTSGSAFSAFVLRAEANSDCIVTSRVDRRLAGGCVGTERAASGGRGRTVTDFLLNPGS
jgi:hypothetical protein